MRWMLLLASILALSGAVTAGAAAGAVSFVESARFTGGFGVVRVSTGINTTQAFVSRDGGRTFRRVPSPGGETEALLLLPNGLGYRTDAHGRLWRTSDAARHWVRTPLRANISDVEAVGTAVWALRSGDNFGGPVRLVVSQDGGRTWTSRPTVIGNGPDGPDGSLAFADAADGVLTGLTAASNLVLRVTRDGGRTWTRRKAPCSPGWTPEKGAPTVRWLPSGAMWFLCYGTPGGGGKPLELHQSFDGGRTFTLRSRTAVGPPFGLPRRQIGRGLGETGGYVVGLDPQDADHATLATGGGVSRSADGGRTWIAQRHLPVGYDNLFDFDADGPTQWLSRRGAALLRSDDAGAHWQRVAVPGR